MITVWIVKQNSDLTEGRGPMQTIGAFTEEQDAWDFADKYGCGVMGRCPRGGSWRNETFADVKVERLNVAETLSELEEVRTREIRERALQKLSTEERRVLGLIK